MARTLTALVTSAALLMAAPDASCELELKSWLGSAFTVPGEETELWLSVISDTRPDQIPETPRTPDVTIQFLNDPVFPHSTRERHYQFQFSIRSYAEGTHLIPPFEVTVKGRALRSQPLPLHVAPLPASAWSTYPLGEEDLRYASAVFTPQRVPFEGETFPVEAKVYVPGGTSISDSTIAELAHDGLVAWRFESSTLPYNGHVFQTSVRLDGRDFVGVSYRSTATPIRSGAVSLGPGHARIQFDLQVPSRGQFVRRQIAARIPVPKHEFRARPLPPNPPPGFRNAVGRFTLAASADTDALREGDPISVLLSVAGNGNLDTIAEPELTAEPSEWKTYEASRLERQGERRDVSGVATFSQIIRPLGSQRVIPPFRLVAFDPLDERYTTLTTPPIPFDVTVSRRKPDAPLTILPDLATPVEQMEGILGVIEPRLQGGAHKSAGWWRFWHFVPGLLAALLLWRIVRRRVLPRFQRPQREKEVLAALHTVEQAGPGAREFLRAAGRFVESWIPGERREGPAETILTRRDQECYRPPDAEATLEAAERRKLISELREVALRSLAILVAAAALLAPGRSAAADERASAFYRQAEAAWEEGTYHAAIDLYRSAHPEGDVPSDVLYNIGNCYFQLGETGLAALHYHRALHQQPDHPEARQNLRFLERKTGAIAVVRPDHKEFLGRFDRSVFSTLLSAGLWTTALALLGLFAALSTSCRVASWLGLTLGPLAAVSGGVTLYLYPRDAAFAPVSEQAVVVSAESVTARTEATVAGAEVISVPPGSLCRPLARRGPWTYVELANQTRGWLPSDLVRLIVSEPAPAPSPATNLGA